MQFLFEFLPILAFFVAYKFGGIYVATVVLIVAVSLQAIVQWLKHRKISPMMLTSAGLVLVFGGITLLFKDPTFIKWKPTILYGLFAVAFIASRFIGDKPLVERVLGEAITVDKSHWNFANTLYALFFVAMGAANLYVAYVYSEETWVYFKFVLLGALMIFTFAIAIWLTSKVPPEAASSEPKNPA
jgi:intracellular septation protein